MSHSVCCALEFLEQRVFLSAATAGHGAITWDDIQAGNAKGRSAPAIRLDLVALHELGHSLGLDHSSDSRSIMYAYYNPNYNINNLASDPIVPTLLAKFANINTSSWKDSLDPTPGNGKVDVTYSYVPDGTALDKSGSTMFRDFDAIFGRSTWQGIFAADFARWASVSGGKLNFVLHSDNGAAAGAAGSAQNDSNFGDIRIGAHRFDGAGKVLAHTYFPPPNGGTVAGDSHYDNAENWVTASSTLAAVQVGVKNANALRAGVLVGGDTGDEV